MIQPSPTDSLSPTLARGTLVDSFPATPSRAAHVVLGFPNSNYQIHLIPTEPITALPGGRIIGVIRASARRVDLVHTGGKYVEPVFGRPRRIQGRVVEANDDTRTLVVDAAIPIHCTLTDPRQRPTQFPVGEMVSFDALDGATLTPHG